MPDAVNYTEARKNLAAAMDKVCETHEEIIITRQKAKSVVMMSLEDYNAIQETAYLLRDPKNAKRLREGVRQAEQGEVKVRGLLK